MLVRKMDRSVVVLTVLVVERRWSGDLQMTVGGIFALRKSGKMNHRGDHEHAYVTLQNNNVRSPSAVIFSSPSSRRLEILQQKPADRSDYGRWLHELGRNFLAPHYDAARIRVVYAADFPEALYVCGNASAIFDFSNFGRFSGLYSVYDEYPLNKKYTMWDSRHKWVIFWDNGDGRWAIARQSGWEELKKYRQNTNRLSAISDGNWWDVNNVWHVGVGGDEVVLTPCVSRMLDEYEEEGVIIINSAQTGLAGGDKFTRISLFLNQICARFMSEMAELRRFISAEDQARLQTSVMRAFKEKYNIRYGIF